MFCAPPVATSEQAKLSAVYLGNASAFNKTNPVTLTPSAGSPSGYRHLMILVAGNATREGTGVSLTNTVTVNGQTAQQIAGWATSSDYPTYSVNAHWQILYANFVTTGTTVSVGMTGNISGGSYSSKHCAVYEVNRKPILVGEAKWKGSVGSGDITIYPDYYDGCMLMGFGSVLENHGTFDVFGYEYLASSIGVTFPASAAQCEITIPAYYNGASGWRVKDYAGAQLSTSYGRTYIGQDYPAGRQGYAVTVR